MGQIQDLSDLIHKFTGGASGAPETIFYYKNGRINGAVATAPIAGRMISLWRYEGYPAAGAVPTTASVIYGSSIGAITLTDASAGFDKYLIQAGGACTQAGTLILYDRLFEMGGFNATATTVTTVQDNPPSPEITRNTSGEGNIVFYEINTAIGSTARTITMEYINQDGNTASGTATIGGTGFNTVSRAQFFSLSGNDHGVRAVTKFQLNGTTGTAGNFSIVIGKPISYIPIGNAGSLGWRDFTTGLPALPNIPNGTALSFLFFAFTTSIPDFFGAISTVQA
jgi:hypothetical protein